MKRIHISSSEDLLPSPIHLKDINPSTASSWNKIHEKLLKDWSEICKIYVEVHQRAVIWCGNWNKIFGIPLIILGGITASSIFASGTNESMTIVNGTLALCMTIINGISEFLSFSKAEVNHQTAASKYLVISMNIDLELSFIRANRRHSPEEFLTQIKQSILDIRENGPNIPNAVIMLYRKELHELNAKSQTVVNCKESNRGKYHKYGTAVFSSPGIMRREINPIIKRSKSFSPVDMKQEVRLTVKENYKDSDSEDAMYIRDIDDTEINKMRELRDIAYSSDNSK